MKLGLLQKEAVFEVKKFNYLFDNKEVADIEIIHAQGEGDAGAYTYRSTNSADCKELTPENNTLFLDIETALKTAIHQLRVYNKLI